MTNSIAITNEFITTLVQLEQGDKKGLCHVTLIGGWCRPTSLATVPHSEEQLSNSSILILSRRNSILLL